MSISARHFYENSQIRYVLQQPKEQQKTPPRLFTTTFASIPESAAAARSWIREVLKPEHPALQDVMLLISELVTNAVIHSDSRLGGQVTAAIAICPGIIHLDVIDSGSSSQLQVRSDSVGESGRGLFLVDQLADRWGTYKTAQGRTVWFEMTW